jgi:SET domain-containing protein
MLLVDARAGMSRIQGIGLIAHELIPQGTCIRILQPGFDLLLTEEQMQALPAPVQRQARRYSYFDPAYNCYILASDDSRFCNHADEPNTVDQGDTIYAARDIYPGEEITWDYRPWGGTEFVV